MPLDPEFLILRSVPPVLDEIMEYLQRKYPQLGHVLQFERLNQQELEKFAKKINNQKTPTAISRISDVFEESIMSFSDFTMMSSNDSDETPPEDTNFNVFFNPTTSSDSLEDLRAPETKKEPGEDEEIYVSRVKTSEEPIFDVKEELQGDVDFGDSDDVEKQPEDVPEDVEKEEFEFPRRSRRKKRNPVVSYRYWD